MDDYNLVIPTVMGYYKTLNINLKLFPGDASGNLPQVAAKQYDMGYASPGVLTASVEAGVPVTSIWEMIPGQVFDFVLPAGSKIKNPRQLRGKTIALYNIGWKAIVDPMLAEVGINPKTVKYREFGPQWNQAVALKLADAGLSWEGLRAQLEGTAAFFGSGNAGLEFLIGSQWGSKGPSNTYQVRTSDLNDAHKVDVYTRLLTGSVMGFEFCRVNPRAAAQIVYEQYPGMQNVITPQVAVNSLMQLASLYSTSRRKPPHQYGYHYPVAWANVSEHRLQARPDEDARPRGRRAHEQLRHARQRQGRQGPGAKGRGEVQAERRVQDDDASRRGYRSNHRAGRGAPRVGRLTSREASMQNPLAGHTNSYHTYGFDEALAGHRRGRATATSN